ncbi:neprilysin-4-like [Ischnura elegans]|uniref:neprilysin-4-like n=1 Tax=Ischnura elegans TaxID=197161 RepID=UPI001ED8792D|nr:neprilysin-4-like [Ischnura elegans]
MSVRDTEASVQYIPRRAEKRIKNGEGSDVMPVDEIEEHRRHRQRSGSMRSVDHPEGSVFSRQPVKSPLEVRLIFLAVLLTLVLLALVGVIGFLMFLNRGVSLRMSIAERRMAAGNCVTPECVRSAARVLDSIDTKKKPCDDFFEFACGSWIESNPIPDTLSSWDQFRVLRDQLLRNLRGLLERNSTAKEPLPVAQAKALYRTCLDTARMEALGVEPMLKVLRRLGLPAGPPGDAGHAVAADFDPLTTVAKSQRVLGLSLFVGFYVSEDLRNTSRNVMVLDQVSPGFNERYLLDPVRFSTEVREYRIYLEDMVRVQMARISSATTAQAAFNSPEVKKAASTFADEILAFSTSLAKIITTSEQRRDVNSLFHELRANELQNLTDAQVEESATGEGMRIDWVKYLTKVMENTDVKLDFNKDFLVVLDATYLQKLANLLSRTKRSTIIRYLWWSIFSTLAPLTVQDFRDLGFRFSQRVLGLSQRSPRWKGCTGNVNSNFGMAVSYLYVQEYFQEKKREKALEMVNDVRHAFEEIVKELQWMDAGTKARTLEKLEAMRPFIGFPGWLLSPGELEAYYGGAEVIEGELFETYIRLSEASLKRALEDIRRTSDKDRWITAATTVNAFYSPILNSVTFPAGILQPPFYGLGLESLNYGAIGAIMGHELTHGFDDQGRRYDKDGNLRMWWSRETLVEYQKRVQCIVDQYNAFPVKQLGGNFSVNGVNTQGENIADNGGLREALRAYRKFRERNPQEPLLPGLAEYSHDQLFFLGFAHMWCGHATNGALRSRVVNGVHAPNRFRVIGTLSNMKEFSEAWGCPAGSPMNPPNKCILW